MGGAYKSRRNSNGPSFVSRLYNRAIDSLDRLWKFMEIGGEDAVGREVIVQNIEELHQSRRNVFRLCQIRCAGKCLPNISQDFRAADGAVVWLSRGQFADFEEALSYGVELTFVDVMHFSVIVDQDCALLRLLCD